MTSRDLSGSTLFNVKGKVVLVTGGSSGIGKMIANGFAQNGAKVYIASRKEAQLKEAAEELNRSATIPVQYIVANVSSKAGCDALIREFKTRENKLHVLINNSGITWGGPYDNFPEEKGWDNVFNVNVKSIFYMTAGLTPLLSKDSTNQDPGRVINISSVSGTEPYCEGALSREGNGTWSYEPSKAAANHLTSALAVKLSRAQITVNAICPGLFPSKMTAFGLHNAGEDAFTSAQPTGRFGQSSDVAGLALFLASPASAHVTGCHIPLDGGARYRARTLPPSAKM
ncbi:rhamnolipids biosynthesis 3-oxoacyl-reductase [Amanita rubescens]|nr:rhamnolipids biosynthesis 3-oxoacyl-reductase [Amanita rubescens]